MSDTDKTTTDTGLSEEVNTSTTEEAQDTDADFDLENSEIGFDDVEDSDDTEESDESTKEEAATESEEDETEESKDDVQDEETKEEDTAPEDNQSKIDAEVQRRLNDEAAKRRIADRKAREEQEHAQLAQYLKDAGDDEEELARRHLQVEAHTLQRERADLNTQRLETDIDRAVADIDLFRTGSPEIKEELALSLDDFERMYVQRDQNGNPLRVQGDVYQYLQSKADSIRRLTGVGARTESQAKSNAKARTDTMPTRAPKEPKKDPLEDGFDEEANRW